MLIPLADSWTTYAQRKPPAAWGKRSQWEIFWKRNMKPNLWMWCPFAAVLRTHRDAEGSKRQSAKPNAGRSARTQRNPQKRQEQGEGKSISTEMLGQLPNLTGTGRQSKETSVGRQKNRADIYKQTPITVKTKFIVWLQAFNCLLQ